MQAINQRVRSAVAGITLRVSFAALALCVFIGSASAEPTPDATVKEIVGKMKSEGNPSVVVDYVNWEKAFADFPEKQREQLNVTNPQELKAFFFEMLAHPTETMRKQMEKRLANVPPERQEEAKQSIEKIEAMMKAKEAEMKERLTNTTYEVGEVKLDGKKATVKLVQTYKDQKRTEDVPLEKDGDRWLLPSVSMVPTQQQAGGAAAPAGAPEAAASSSSAPDAKPTDSASAKPTEAPKKEAAAKPTAKKNTDKKKK